MNNQLDVPKYINQKTFKHKLEINAKFTQWKVKKADKLSVLQDLCLKMSCIAHLLVSDKTYMSMVMQIDEALSKFGDSLRFCLCSTANPLPPWARFWRS